MSVRVNINNLGKCSRCRKKKPSYILDVATHTESDFFEDQFVYLYLCRACKIIEMNDDFIFINKIVNKNDIQSFIKFGDKVMFLI